MQRDFAGVENSKPVTILLVEDDTIDVRAVVRAFRKHRINNPIMVASNGLIALEMLQGINGQPRVPRPYVVLLDLNMPQMNGHEFLREIRKDPDLKRSIVFVLTTSKARQDKENAYERHVAGYILKSEAGRDFVDLAQMLDRFVITVRFVEEADDTQTLN